MENKKCIIICNGPSVVNINNYNYNFDEYDFIAVNRWNKIFKLFNLKKPKYVIVGKNSLNDNLQNILKNDDILFYGFNNNIRRNNYKLLKFGNYICYDKVVNCIGSLWWSGIYAIQLAIQKEYDEIHIFGFTCTNGPDFADNYKRAIIPIINIKRVFYFFNELKNKNILKHLHFHEKNKNHILHTFIK